MAPICNEFKKNKIPFKLCVTAQHREMLDQVLYFFELEPDYDLNLMQPNQNLNELSSRIINDVDTVFNSEKFDLILVHGDTTTSAMVALAAFHKGIKVGHIEAGLRTYNKSSPFPEELNRQLTGRIADFHFVPTEKAMNNLLKEGINKQNIIYTGNTVVDALLYTIEKLKKGFSNSRIENLKAKLNFDKNIILVTGHRRESFGEGFANLCDALLKISEKDDVEIVYPVHLNPNVQKTVYYQLSEVRNIHLIQPLDYASFVWLMSKSSLIISDSGGVQEEAPSLKIPVIVTRNETERKEGMNSGFSFLTGTNSNKIIETTLNLLHGKFDFTNKENPYGDGKASIKIVNFIQNNFN
jgi:UDP-N-acetylglucosamine 2-epimerase (non-hydrolysing)